MNAPAISRGMISQPETPFPWEDLPDEELLLVRLCDLRLRLPGSSAEPRVQRLYEELTDHGIHFHPACYLTTEWLCPDRIPLIGIPFCLAHPRLTALERSMMLEVEGGTEKCCMQLLRHEMGHAINYAYKLYRRTRWRELFGPITQEYDAQEYYPRPYSRQFVEHLPDNYAQAHPDEDFAETFAVWLTPTIDWRKRYKGWKALQKLEYVDHLMAEIGERPPLLAGGDKLWPIGRMRSTLKTYYEKKRKEFGDGYPGYYDPELLKIFTTEAPEEGQSAWQFLGQNRRHLVNQIARWSNLRKYEIDFVLRRMHRRARELDLYLRDGEHECLLHMSICVTSMLSDQRVRRQERSHR